MKAKGKAAKKKFVGQLATEIFKALSDNTRIRIVAHLLKHGETSCQKLSENFSLSQPTLCHHFTRLAEAGILNVRKKGVTKLYKVNNSALKAVGLDWKPAR